MILLLSQSLQSLVKLRLILGNYLKGGIPVFSGSCTSDGFADYSVDDVTAVFVFLLWDDIMAFTFGMQEKLSFIACLCGGWSFGKHFADDAQKVSS